MSALALLMLVDCRLHRRFRRDAGRLVLGLGVRIAPVAEFVGVALEVRVNVARHQLVAALGRRPVRPIVRQQQERRRSRRSILSTVARNGGRNRPGLPMQARPDGHEVLGRVRRDVGRDDGEGRHFTEIAFEVLEAELDVRPRLFGRFRHMGEGDDTPFSAVGHLAGWPSRFPRRHPSCSRAP